MSFTGTGSVTCVSIPAQSPVALEIVMNSGGYGFVYPPDCPLHTLELKAMVTCVESGTLVTVHPPFHAVLMESHDPSVLFTPDIWRNCPTLSPWGVAVAIAAGLPLLKDVIAAMFASPWDSASNSVGELLVPPEGLMHVEVSIEAV